MAAGRLLRHCCSRTQQHNAAQRCCHRQHSCCLSRLGAWAHDHAPDTPVCCAASLAVQAAQAAAATDDYEAAINRTASELYSALDSAMESKS